MEKDIETYVNRRYKDRLFKLIFRDKKDLLQLYNAINNTAYDNPNLPLRGLLYFARLYQKIVNYHKDIYSSKIIKLPYPQFIVFYNGTKDEPERQILELSDAFPEWSKKKMQRFSAVRLC